MSRLGAIFWLAVVVAAGFTTFKVKYAIQDLEDELRRVRKQTIAEQQEIRVLTAEWTYLNQPERLAELNRRFLALTPIAVKQLQRGVDEIPLRPPLQPDVALAASLQLQPPQPIPARNPPVVAQAAPAVPAVTSPALPIATAVLTAARPAHPMRLATAGNGPGIRSLDALIAQIAEAR